MLRRLSIEKLEWQLGLGAVPSKSLISRLKQLLLLRGQSLHHCRRLASLTHIIVLRWCLVLVVYFVASQVHIHCLRLIAQLALDALIWWHQ